MNRDCGFESHGFRSVMASIGGSWSNRKTLVLQTGNSGANPDESTAAMPQREWRVDRRKLTEANVIFVYSLAESGPVAQRRRQLPYKKKNGGSSPPGTISVQVRQRLERLGLNPSDCGFESRLGHRDEYGSVGNWQTTLA